jgi:hypothetical protein
MFPCRPYGGITDPSDPRCYFACYGQLDAASWDALMQHNLSHQPGSEDGRPLSHGGQTRGRNPINGEDSDGVLAAVGSHVMAQQLSRGESGLPLPHSAEAWSRTRVVRHQGDPLAQGQNDLRQEDWGSSPKAVKEENIGRGSGVPGSVRGVVEGNGPGQSDIGYRGCCQPGFCYRPALGSSNPMGSCASCPSVVDRCALWMTYFL